MNDFIKPTLPAAYNGPKPQGAIPDILYKIAFPKMMIDYGFHYLPAVGRDLYVSI
mgnify:CR=1 FL=1